MRFAGSICDSLRGSIPRRNLGDCTGSGYRTVAAVHRPVGCEHARVAPRADRRTHL